MEKIDFKVVRSEQAPVVKQDVCRLILHDAYVELLLSYDYMTKQSKEDVAVLEITRLHQLTPKEGLAISRTFYTSDLEPRNAPDEMPPLYHAIILEYQGREFWLYTSEEEADKMFKALKRWLLKPSKKLNDS